VRAQIAAARGAFAIRVTCVRLGRELPLESMFSRLTRSVLATKNVGMCLRPLTLMRSGRRLSDRRYFTLRNMATQMFLIRGDTASNLLWRCKQQVADAKPHARAFTWLHALVDQEREGISAVGFTLKEVYSVLCCGNFEDPDRSASNTICSPEMLAELQPAGPAPYCSFVRKAKRLSPVQRVGVAMALDETWSNGDREHSERIRNTFARHGIELRGTE
jgi:hypothetical protein